jgi:uncharacterized protein
VKSTTLYSSKKKSFFFSFVRFILFFSLYFILFLSVFSQNKDIPNRPSPQRLVNDFAGIFKPQQILILEKMLVAYNDSTSTQIAVVTIESLNGYDISDFTDRLAEKWEVGRKGKDNGVVILIKPKMSTSDYGEVRISVGYGLEDVIPDATAKRIISQEMLPHFQEEDYYRGVSAAVVVIMNLASGKYTAEQYEEVDMVTVIIVVGSIILLFVLLLVFAKRFNKGNTTKLPFIIFPGGFGSSGGGGRSGGFGGFGGGSFGGGGARGRW